MQYDNQLWMGASLGRWSGRRQWSSRMELAGAGKRNTGDIYHIHHRNCRQSIWLTGHLFHCAVEPQPPNSQRSIWLTTGTTVKHRIVAGRSRNELIFRSRFEEQEVGETFGVCRGFTHPIFPVKPMTSGNDVWCRIELTRLCPAIFRIRGIPLDHLPGSTITWITTQRYLLN